MPFNMEVHMNGLKLRARKFLERQLSRSDFIDLINTGLPREFLFSNILIRLRYFGDGYFQITVSREDGLSKFLMETSEFNCRRRN